MPNALKVLYLNIMRGDVFLRPAVKLGRWILRPLANPIESQADYVKHIQEFERWCEKEFIETFKRIGIKAIVKSAPYSLPYTNEIIVRRSRSSYVNESYFLPYVTRSIVKQLIEEDAHKVRFYFLNNVLTEELEEDDCVEYRFRYTLHK